MAKFRHQPWEISIWRIVNTEDCENHWTKPVLEALASGLAAWLRGRGIVAYSRRDDLILAWRGSLPTWIGTRGTMLTTHFGPIKDVELRDLTRCGTIEIVAKLLREPR